MSVSSLVVVSATTLLRGYYYSFYNEIQGSINNNDDTKLPVVEMERISQNQSNDESYEESKRSRSMGAFASKERPKNENTHSVSKSRRKAHIRKRIERTQRGFLSSLFSSKQKLSPRIDEEYSQTIVVVVESEKPAFNPNIAATTITSTTRTSNIPGSVLYCEKLATETNDQCSTCKETNDSSNNCISTCPSSFQKAITITNTDRDNELDKYYNANIMIETKEWLGGEKNMFPVDVEYEAVRDIFEQLSSDEQRMIIATDKTIPIRHYRAEKGNVSKAVLQIKATLRWREEFGVDKLKQCWGPFDLKCVNKSIAGTNSSDHAELRSILDVENATGKIYVRGYDRDGRALMYMTPSYTNTNHELDNIRHLVWNFEKAIECTKRRSFEITGKRLEKINLIIDYDGFQIKHTPPLSTTKYTLDVLQKYYPERMYHAYLLNPPFIFQGFWNCIKMFVDPTTKEKIIFCTGKDGIKPLLNNVVDQHKLEARSGGPRDSVAFESNRYQQLPIDVSYDE